MNYIALIRNNTISFLNVNKMSALTAKSFKSKISATSKRHSDDDTKEISFYDDRPKPINFDTFLPWICLEMQVSNYVIVTRKNQGLFFCILYNRYGQDQNLCFMVK
jgi:hypothetical protein